MARNLITVPAASCAMMGAPKSSAPSQRLFGTPGCTRRGCISLSLSLPSQCREQSGDPWLAKVCCWPSVTSCALQRMPCAFSPLAQAFLDSLSQRALAMENFLHLKLTFFSPSHAFCELKGNIISNLIYSYCTSNSVYPIDPTRKGCPSLVQVADILGTSAPMSFSCTLHSRH